MTPTSGRPLRPVLWLVLILRGGANAATSSIATGAGDHANLMAGLGAAFGVIALGSAVALIVDHYKHRRSEQR